MLIVHMIKNKLESCLVQNEGACSSEASHYTLASPLAAAKWNSLQDLKDRARVIGYSLEFEAPTLDKLMNSILNGTDPTTEEMREAVKDTESHIFLPAQYGSTTPPVNLTEEAVSRAKKRYITESESPFRDARYSQLTSKDWTELNEEPTPLVELYRDPEVKKQLLDQKVPFYARTDTPESIMLENLHILIDNSSEIKAFSDWDYWKVAKNPYKRPIRLQLRGVPESQVFPAGTAFLFAYDPFKNEIKREFPVFVIDASAHPDRSLGPDWTPVTDPEGSDRYMGYDWNKYESLYLYIVTLGYSYEEALKKYQEKREKDRQDAYEFNRSLDRTVGWRNHARYS